MWILVGVDVFYVMYVIYVVDVTGMLKFYGRGLF